MKVFIMVILLSFLVNTIAQAKSITTKSGEPPPPPPPWAQVASV